MHAAHNTSSTHDVQERQQVVECGIVQLPGLAKCHHIEGGASHVAGSMRVCNTGSPQNTRLVWSKS